jgi:hypothetical protein
VTGVELITRHQKIYGSGLLMGDSLLMGGGLLIGDGLLTGDGLLMGNGLLMGDGLLVGDVAQIRLRQFSMAMNLTRCGLVLTRPGENEYSVG